MNYQYSPVYIKNGMIKSLWQKFITNIFPKNLSTDIELFSPTCYRTTAIKLPSIIHQFLSSTNINKMLIHHHYHNDSGYFIFYVKK